VPDHRSGPAGHLQPGQARGGPPHGRHPGDRDHGLEYVDDHDAQREALAVGAQGVRAAGVAAALGTDVHADEPAQHQAAVDRAQQVGRE